MKFESRSGARQAGNLCEVAVPGGLILFCHRRGCQAAAAKSSEEAMKSLALKVQRFLVSEDGPTAVEYAVMLALIVVVCLGTITTIGTSANGTFNTISNALPSAS